MCGASSPTHRTSPCCLMMVTHFISSSVEVSWRQSESAVQVSLSTNSLQLACWQEMCVCVWVHIVNAFVAVVAEYYCCSCLLCKLCSSLTRIMLFLYAGYPFRRTFAEFLNQFWQLYPAGRSAAAAGDQAAAAACRELLALTGMSEGADYQVGVVCHWFVEG